MRTLYDRFRFFHDNLTLHVVGHTAEQAYALAKAEEQAEREGLTVTWEDETDEWDGDCPPPKVHAHAFVNRPNATRRYDLLASLGSIALESWSDPVMRTFEAELFVEALHTLRRDREQARTTEEAISSMAEELASRATFAAGCAS